MFIYIPNSRVHLSVFKLCRFRVQYRHRLLLQKLQCDSNPGLKATSLCCRRSNHYTKETTYSKRCNV